MWYNEKGDEPCNTKFNEVRVLEKVVSAFFVFCSYGFMSFVADNVICSLLSINGMFSLLSVVSDILRFD
jgi:hypothetical protein